MKNKKGKVREMNIEQPVCNSSKIL